MTLSLTRISDFFIFLACISSVDPQRLEASPCLAILAAKPTPQAWFLEASMRFGQLSCISCLQCPERKFGLIVQNEAKFEPARKLADDHKVNRYLVELGSALIIRLQRLLRCS